RGDAQGRDEQGHEAPRKGASGEGPGDKRGDSNDHSRRYHAGTRSRADAVRVGPSLLATPLKADREGAFGVQLAVPKAPELSGTRLGHAARWQEQYAIELLAAVLADAGRDLFAQAAGSVLIEAAGL